MSDTLTHPNNHLVAFWKAADDKFCNASLRWHNKRGWILRGTHCGAYLGKIIQSEAIAKAEKVCGEFGMIRVL